MSKETHPPTTARPLPIGSRVRVGRDDRMAGIIECYEFPPTGGRAFVKVDQPAGQIPGYWCQPYDIEALS
jgi:hypothetical protein